MYEINYHRASSVDEAAALFAKGSEAKYLAGGQTLLPVMKQRLASPSDVIDLAKIKEMVGIAPTGNGIEIKGATTHYDVAQSDIVKKAIPALAYLASVIGDPAVRHRAPSAARSPTTILLRTIPRRSWRSMPRSRPTSARFRRMSSSPACSDGLAGRRDHHRRLVPGHGEGGLLKVPQSGVALCDDRRLCGEGGWRRSRRSRRCVAKRRHAGTGDRGGAEGELVGRRNRQRQDFRRWPLGRYPRFRGLPRQPHKGHGAARGDRGRLSVSTQLAMQTARSDARRSVFGRNSGNCCLPPAP